MGFAPAALAIGSTAFGAATSAMQAREQNRALQRSMESQREATIAQQQQLAERAGLERLRNERQAAQAMGRIRASAAESGISLASGSVMSLENQAVADRTLNQQIIDQNFQNQVARVRSGAQANLASLSSQQQNPILAGISGALGGAQTGLAIGQSVEALDNLSQTPRPQQTPTLPTPRTRQPKDQP